MAGIHFILLLETFLLHEVINQSVILVLGVTYRSLVSE